MTASALLLGHEYPALGELVVVDVNQGNSAASLSAGGDAISPGLVGKKDASHPNEDALFARDDGDLVLAAVADAHFGWQSSHRLMKRLKEWDGIPHTPDDLSRMLPTLSSPEPTDGSASTLVISVYQRSTGVGFGFSFGDSSIAVVGPDGARVVNSRDTNYVDPSQPRSLIPPDGSEFRFFARTSELILVFTDGINECEYRNPAASIQERHLAALYQRVNEPGAFARQLTEMALAGVDGNAGGQDNIALVVSRA